ncbi:MAG: helix-hairpin-helix domain-containing protein [Candidatus Omnitrophica bacterium]|nr:helix-hairpin-helix domain-containing protein [Candidatus Omnitrophota bacterium]
MNLFFKKQIRSTDNAIDSYIMEKIDRVEKRVLTVLVLFALIGVGVKYCLRMGTAPRLITVSSDEALKLESISDDLAESKQVNINTAGVKELARLKGIGPSLAGRIIEYRNKFGPFTKEEDLLAVKGIGAKKLEGIRDVVVIE